MDDVIEHGEHHSVKYENYFLPLLLTGIQNSHPEVRQASAYGIGVLAKHGGHTFAKTFSGIFQILIEFYLKTYKLI